MTREPAPRRAGATPSEPGPEGPGGDSGADDLYPPVPATAAPLPPAPRPSRRILWAIALLVAAFGWGWLASADLRETWWAAQPAHVLAPDAGGFVTGGPVSVRLVAVDDEPSVDERAPRGYAYLAVTLAVTVSDEGSRTCTVELIDADGRRFEAGAQVPSGEPWTSSLRCGVSESYPELPPTQTMLVLLPQEAQPQAIRVLHNDLPSASVIEFPLG